MAAITGGSAVFFRATQRNCFVVEEGVEFGLELLLTLKSTIATISSSPLSTISSGFFINSQPIVHLSIFMKAVYINICAAPDAKAASLSKLVSEGNAVNTAAYKARIGPVEVGKLEQAKIRVLSCLSTLVNLHNKREVR